MTTAAQFGTLHASLRFVVVCGGLLSLASILVGTAWNTWSVGYLSFGSRFGGAGVLLTRGGEGATLFYAVVGLAVGAGVLLFLGVLYLVARLLYLPSPERRSFLERTVALPRRIYWLLWLFIVFGVLAASSRLVHLGA